MFKLMSLWRTVHFQPRADTLSKYSHIVSGWVFDCCKNITQSIIEPSLRFTSPDAGILCECKLQVSLFTHFCVFSWVHLWLRRTVKSQHGSNVEKATPQLNGKRCLAWMESSRMSGNPYDFMLSDWGILATGVRDACLLATLSETMFVVWRRLQQSPEERGHIPLGGSMSSSSSA